MMYETQVCCLLLCSLCIFSSSLLSLLVSPSTRLVTTVWNFSIISQNFAKYFPLLPIFMVLAWVCADDRGATLLSLYLSYAAGQSSRETTQHPDTVTLETRAAISHHTPATNPEVLSSFLFASAISVKYLSKPPFSFIDIMKGNV